MEEKDILKLLDEQPELLDNLATNLKDPKSLMVLANYADLLQNITLWLCKYRDNHTKLNATQHDYVDLQTCKQTGLRLDHLIEKHNKFVEDINVKN